MNAAAGCFLRWFLDRSKGCVGLFLSLSLSFVDGWIDGWMDDLFGYVCMYSGGAAADEADWWWVLVWLEGFRAR